VISFEILKWDSDFFGFTIAKINDKFISLRDFRNIYKELKNKKVKLLYWPSDLNFSFQHEISKEFNGRLVDVKTRYKKEIKKGDRYIIEGQIFTELYKELKPDDKMLEIALQCGEYSRFKVDPHFPSEKFVELYKTWLIKSLIGDLADEVIITKKDDLITGLITVNCDEGIGNIGLVGVHNDYRRMGQGDILIRTALNFFNENKCHTAYVITQEMNHEACKLYEKYGFTVDSKTNFYHFWIK